MARRRSLSDLAGSLKSFSNPLVRVIMCQSDSSALLAVVLAYQSGLALAVFFFLTSLCFSCTWLHLGQGEYRAHSCMRAVCPPCVACSSPKQPIPQEEIAACCLAVSGRRKLCKVDPQGSGRRGIPAFHRVPPASWLASWTAWECWLFLISKKSTRRTTACFRHPTGWVVGRHGPLTI